MRDSTLPAEPRERRSSGELVAVPCSILRGGTSKAVFLEDAVVPAAPDARTRFLLALMGSPDPRQIDGLGGADLLTSKVAIIGPPSVSGADLDYTFAQVSVSDARVDYDINCGNVSAAVGVYAVEHGLVELTGDAVVVGINNVNTGRVFYAEVPISQGHARVEGGCQVDGVPGSGAEIILDLRNTVGTLTGSLLPTGSPIDSFEVPGIGSIDVSIVDIAYLCFAVRAVDLGLGDRDIPVKPSDDLLRAVDLLQRFVARHLGLPEGTLVPVPILVSEPHDYRTLAAGDTIKGGDVDIVAEV
ncbi:MAG: PrpF domain-containing protein, partial [Acidimicrobiales bacterium]